MPFYRDHIYPHLVRVLGDPKPFREVRQRIVPLAQGTVLEIGVGPGVNFVHYDPARVSKVYALEPNPGMIRLAERQRLRTKLDIAFLDLPGERIPLADGSVDTVVSTFTLCTIPGVVEMLHGVRRVLKPGGNFIFLEHGLSPDPRVRRWQEWSEPIPHCLFEGCHVTRDIPSLIAQSGFGIGQVETLPHSRRRGRTAGGAPQLPAMTAGGPQSSSRLLTTAADVIHLDRPPSHSLLAGEARRPIRPRTGCGANNEGRCSRR